MQIVEHHHDRRLLGCRHEELGGAFPQQQPFRVGIRHPVGVGSEGGHQTPQCGALRSGQPGDELGVTVTDQGRDNFDPGLIRDPDVLIGVAEQHDRTVSVRGPCDLRHQSGLAHAGLTGHEHRLTPFGRVRLLAHLVQDGQLGATTEEPEQRIGRGTHETPGQRNRPGLLRGLPQHLDRIDRFGKTFQLQRPDLDERLRRVPAHEVPHDLRREDLSTGGRRAQPGCLDHRITEEVAVLLDSFARAHADTNAQRLTVRTVVMVDCLLHPHRARQRPTRRREHHHESVTQILDLGAARADDRASQQPEMGLA